MRDSQAYDIAIVGGGMVGLTLALLLAKESARGRPWRIALLESQPFKSNAAQGPGSSFDARSTALAEGSRHIFERCQVWSHLADRLTVIKQVHVSDRGHFAGNLLDAKALGYEALGYVVENPQLGQALMSAVNICSSIDLKAPIRVDSLKKNTEGWRLELAADDQGTSLNCKLLVLADGAKSKLAQSLGISYHRAGYGQQAIIANVECDQAHRGIAYERFTDSGPIALLPLGLGQDSYRSALVWTRPQDETQAILELDDKQFCQRLQNEFGHRGGRFCRVSQRHVYQLELSTAKEQIRDGLVVVGNAAHFLHPVAGQGFNLALRDCQALVDTLAGIENPGDLATLQTYLQNQQQDQSTTIGLSHSLVKLFSTGALPSALLRSLGLLGLDAIAPAKSLFAHQAMGFPLARNAS